MLSNNNKSIIIAVCVACVIGAALYHHYAVQHRWQVYADSEGRLWRRCASHQGLQVHYRNAWYIKIGCDGSVPETPCLYEYTD